jgi:ribosomal protein L29
MIDGWELYDLEKDPNELNSLYGQDRLEEITTELKAELARLRTQYQVTEDTRPLPKIIREIY